MHIQVKTLIQQSDKKKRWQFTMLTKTGEIVQHFEGMDSIFLSFNTAYIYSCSQKIAVHQ